MWQLLLLEFQHVFKDNPLFHNLEIGTQGHTSLGSTQNFRVRCVFTVTLLICRHECYFWSKLGLYLSILNNAALLFQILPFDSSLLSGARVTSS